MSDANNVIDRKYLCIRFLYYFHLKRKSENDCYLFVLIDLIVYRDGWVVLWGDSCRRVRARDTN